MNIYISSAIKNDFREVVKLASEEDLNIEICKFINPDNLDEGYNTVLSEYKDILQDFQGELSLHGAFYDLNPSSKDLKIKEITIQRYNQSYEAAKTLNAKTVVFHTGYNALVKSQAYFDSFIQSQTEFWIEHIKKFEDAGITVALENTYEDVPEIILSMVKGVNSKYLKTCIDVGHVNINSGLDPSEWVKRMGEKLHHMHIHNNFGQMDDHNSLKSGTINFAKMINAIKKDNLNPNLTLEIFNYEPAIESISILKDLLKQEIGVN